MVKFTKTRLIYLLFLLISIYIIKELNFVYYNSVDSPDFDTYSVYFEYLFYNLDSTGREQGLFYYFLNSWNYFIKNKTIEDLNLLTLLHASIQQVNFYLFLVGIIGLYKLLKFYKFSDESIVFTLIAVNLLPISIALRIVFKPEIITLALLPWIIFNLENYILNKNIKHLYLALPLITTVLSSKGNMAVMLAVSLIVFYFKLFLLIPKKHLLILVVLIFTLFSFVYLEDSSSNGLNLTQLESGSSSDSNYDFKAPINFIYKINGYELVSSPIKNNHADSFIAITLLDTFGDYYDIYWDNDSSLYFKNRKDILLFEQSDNISTPKFDVKNKTITFYLQNLTDTYYKKVLGLILSLFFYFLFFYSILHDKKYRKFYLMTVLSVILLLVHAIFGIPSNNFNPNLGDTLKPLYYSPFLLLSSSFMLARVFEIKKNRIKLLFFIPLLLIILGFPKSVDAEYSRDLTQINNYSFFCEINKKLILNDNLDIKDSCKPGIVIRQADYEFMDVSSYQTQPRKLLANLVLLILNILSISLIFSGRLYRKYIAKQPNI